jgi:hypothetical protein
MKRVTLEIFENLTVLKSNIHYATLSGNIDSDLVNRIVSPEGIFPDFVALGQFEFLGGCTLVDLVKVEVWLVCVLRIHRFRSLRVWDMDGG